MKNRFLVSTTLLAISFLGATAQAAPLLEVSGRVALADGTVPAGTTVRLQVDLNRDRKFSRFETLSAQADATGAYVLRYELDLSRVDLEFISFVSGLLVEYESRGFEALLDDGPLPAVVSFEREGYSTVVKKLTTLLENPHLDALLAPLSAVHCTADGCRTPSGAVQVKGFVGGSRIARAHAEAYDPSADLSRFPGSFSDSEDNLLISSGFMEIDFRDASGRRVTEVSEPVKVRFEASRDAWPTLRDLRAGTSGIEVPMYSFDETLAEWVAEEDGLLEDADGTPLAEAELQSIQEGSRTAPVFISFSTRHFSTWNCDRPIETRTCVKGRLVDEDGAALAGVSVSVNGVSYTGSAGMMLTGPDGAFASDLMKSEMEGEDIDRNGQTGETFTAQLRVAGAGGVYVGPVFDSPTDLRSMGINLQGQTSCAPAACDCVELGDVTVAFEAPRACEVSVVARYSGSSLSGNAAFEAGAVIPEAKVSGQLAGGSVPASAAASLCAGTRCYGATATAEGTVTFVVPVLGEEPSILLRAEYSVDVDGFPHYYTGTKTIEGCRSDAGAMAVDIELDHIELTSMATFISSLGPGPSSGSRLSDLREPGCGCRAAGGVGSAGGLALAMLSALGWRWRRRATRKPR